MSNKLLAYHFDLKRARWRRDYMDCLVARLKAWGFNTILYEMEDKFLFSRHPDLAHPEAWTREQTADFVQSCRQQGLEVIPMFQSLGHAESVVGKPPYAHLRETPEVADQYDPLSEDARALLRELFDEIIETFRPREFFHIGGDETWSLGKSEKCRPIVEQLGGGGLYLRHMQPLFEHLHARGLRPMIWADIVLQHPEVLDQIPKYVVLVDWNYARCAERSDRVLLWGAGRFTWPEFQALPDSPAKQLAARFAVDDQTKRDGTFRDFYHTDALVARGFDVVTASACRSAGDSIAMPRAAHLENVFHSARKGKAAGTGEIVTSWAVRHCHPELTMPAAFAARPTGVLDRAAIMSAYTVEQFGVALPELEEAWRLLSPCVPFSEMMVLWPAARLLADGTDPIAQYRQDLRNAPHHSRLVRLLPGNFSTPEEWVAAMIQQTESRRAGYLRARRILEKMKPDRNSDGLDYWRDAAEVSLFCADFALAMLREEKSALAPRIPALRERTRQLWEKTYTPGSVAEELDTRYGFYEVVLGVAGNEKLAALLR